MNSFFWFSTAMVVTFVLLVVFLSKHRTSYKFEASALITILMYRITSWIDIGLGGNFNWKYSVNAGFVDHSWVGLVIVGLVLLFWPKDTLSGYREVVIGIGAGMSLDEISEILAWFGVPFSHTFRDSVPDFFLILFSYAVIMGVKWLYFNLRLGGLNRRRS